MIEEKENETTRVRRHHHWGNRQGLLCHRRMSSSRDKADDHTIRGKEERGLWNLQSTMWMFVVYGKWMMLLTSDLSPFQ